MVRASFASEEGSVRVVVIRWWSFDQHSFQRGRHSPHVTHLTPALLLLAVSLLSLHSSPLLPASRYHDCGCAMYGLHGLQWPAWDCRDTDQYNDAGRQGLQRWSSPVGHAVMPTSSSTARLYRSRRSKDDAADWALLPPPSRVLLTPLHSSSMLSW